MRLRDENNREAGWVLEQFEYEVVIVHLSTSGRPTYRYVADMHLPDHLRREVAPEHRLDWTGA